MITTDYQKAISKYAFERRVSKMKYNFVKGGNNIVKLCRLEDKKVGFFNDIRPQKRIIKSRINKLKEEYQGRYDIALSGIYNNLYEIIHRERRFFRIYNNKRADLLNLYV